MNILDILMNGDNAEVVCGNRILRGQVDKFGEFKDRPYFVVTQKNRKRPMVETENEDEACRVLTGKK